MTDQIPPGSAVITPGEMLAEIHAARADITEIKGMLTPTLNDIKSGQADHEKRIRTLESRMYRAAGASALAASTIALIVEYFASHR